ncbi:MAG: hypothetical protein F6J92_38800 [Symploca sp. SIO1A3]|nr:hypothetical protein [Symploca sp. SIO1A3]
MQNLEAANQVLHVLTAKAYIEQVLNQLLLDYQNTQLEREKIALWEANQEFSILGIIEFLTDELRGYAFQVITNDFAVKASNILEELEKLKILEITEIQDWYLASELDYPQMKHYIEMLNYLRLLLIEYIRDIKA